VSPSGVMVPKD